MLNNCEFIGNLRLACTEKWKDKNTGERKEHTEWVSVAIFGPLAGVAGDYLKKGSKVYLSGKFSTRKWQDQSGQDRYSTEIVLRGPTARMVMLDSPSGERREYDQSPGSGSTLRDMEDDIPF